MSSKGLLPKQWKLNTTETQNSFDSWRESIIWHISIDEKSSRFLTDLKTWSNGENRGFVNDGDGFSNDTKMTAIAKKSLLNIVLGSIASNAPVISPRFIKNVATSLDEIWSRLRSYYGFRKTGSRITEFTEFKLEPSETREALWERMYTFLEDNLLTVGGDVIHEGEAPTVNEEFSPTLLCVLVVNWLGTIHPSLPSAVRQRFPTQLRTNTIYSIRDDISDAIPSILEEIEDRAGINRLSRFAESNSKFSSSGPKSKFSHKDRFAKKKRCCLCAAADRHADGHFLSECPYLPPEDKRFWSKTRDINVGQESDDEFDENHQTAGTSMVRLPTSRRIDIMPSPVVGVSICKG